MSNFFKLCGIIVILHFSSCVEIARPYDQLPPGMWRAELRLDEESTLPFNLDSSYDPDGNLKIHIINGKERIEVEEVSFGRTSDLRDTVLMTFSLMDSYISAEYKENVMEGFWHVNYRGDYDIPFIAFFGQGHRFTTDRIEPTANLTGKWEARFEVETDTPYPAIGEFKQVDNKLFGTFLTETGDYRYLEGTIQGNKMFLSCFDGGHSFLFSANISDSGVLSGQFLNGKHYKTNWVARRNSEAVLRDPYNLSQITTPDKRIDFSLMNTEGVVINLNDEQYKGKPKLISIMGTWCPNCLDESKFLVDYLNKNPELDIEIIALAFEKYRDPSTALSVLKNYKERLNVPFEILYAGYFDKAEATETLGFIDKVISYPTLLFVDRQNQVKRVHTGFAGPATSEWDNFITEFESSIQMIKS